MIKSIRRLRRATTSLMSIALILNLHIWAGGCGEGGLFSPDGKIRIALTQDHPLTQTLAGSTFDGASILEIDTTAGRFELIFPDSDHNLSGQFLVNKGKLAITDLFMARGSLSEQWQLDLSGHLTSVTDSAGRQWTRPATWTGLPPEAASQGVDPYVAANVELVGAARELDLSFAPPTSPSTTTGGTGTPPGTTPTASPGDVQNDKTQAALELPIGLQNVFGILRAVLDMQLAQTVLALFFVFQLLGVMDLSMAMAGVGSLPNSASNSAGAATGPLPTGSALLRVSNNLSDGTPIWFVTLLKDSVTGASGGNVLGDESIPSGESRDFSVPPGTRDINLIIPNGTECFVIHERRAVLLEDGITKELILDDTDVGKVFPEGCGSG